MAWPCGLAFYLISELRMSKIIKLRPRRVAGWQGGRPCSSSPRSHSPASFMATRKEPRISPSVYNELQPACEYRPFMSTLVDLEVDGAVVRRHSRDIQFEAGARLHQPWLIPTASARIARIQCRSPGPLQEPRRFTGLKKGLACSTSCATRSISIARPTSSPTRS